MNIFCVFCFFFSSRRRHTRCGRDWSSDVCSSDLEALSVTPFSPTSLERGIDGVLVSAARVISAHRADGLSPEGNAGRIGDQAELMATLIARLRARIEPAARRQDVVDQASQRLDNRLDQWNARVRHVGN